MTGDGISEDVKAFMAEHIRSVGKLELLLLLHSDRARDWSADELARELRVARDWTQRECADLVQLGLVARPGSTERFQYAPGDAELNATVERLAAYYAERRVSVIEFLYTAPSGPIQSFADAFRLRKGPSDG